jgi:hypothetical protein
VPTDTAQVKKNKKLYKMLTKKGMPAKHAATIANAPTTVVPAGNAKSAAASRKGKQGGTTAQHKAAGSKGGKTTAKKTSAKK